MGNKEVRQPQLLLEAHQQIDHLSLDRHIQSRNGFITDDKLRVHGQRPGNADSLTLSAGEFVREAVRMFLVEPHQA